jgi:hypothetical protein
VFIVEGEKTVVDESLCSAAAIGALTFREQTEVKAFAGAQGGGQLVVISRVTFDWLTVEAACVVLDAIDVLADVVDVP